MTTMPRPNDPTQSFTATYDGWNRLVKLAAGSTTVSEYAYDGSKRRIVQKTYTSDSLTETRHMYYTASWQSIEERLGTSPDSADAERQFIWGLRYIDDCVLRDRDTNNDGNFDERLYSQQDANWNVTAIVDETGAVQERYAYTAYGQPKFLTATFADRSSSSYTWESLYCGYRYESATWVFHVRNRVYHQVVGTWVQRDPLGYFGGVSLFGYAGTFPVDFTDPTGLRVRLCVRQFLPGKNTVGDYKTWYDKGIQVLGTDTGPIGHVYLMIGEDDTTTTYSYHPNEWPLELAGLAVLRHRNDPKKTFDSNQERPARVWVTFPSDLYCTHNSQPIAFWCFELPCEVTDEERLREYINRWIKTNGVGYEEGAPVKISGTDNEIGATVHKVPASSCKATYWVGGHNCGWWATQMVSDVGIKIPNRKAEKDRITGWNQKGAGMNIFFKPGIPADAEDYLTNFKCASPPARTDIYGNLLDD